jgi:hypothetical protein
MRAYERRLPYGDKVGQALLLLFVSTAVCLHFPPERLRNGRAVAARDKLRDYNRAGPLFLSRPGDCEWDGSGSFGRRAFWTSICCHTTSDCSAMPLKGFTDHAANRLLGGSGAFWQDES